MVDAGAIYFRYRYQCRVGLAGGKLDVAHPLRAASSGKVDVAQPFRAAREAGLKANAVRKFVTDRTAVSCATRPAAGSVSRRRAGSVSPKNGVALAALSLARPSCRFATSLRSTSPASGNASVRVTSRQTAAQASASRRFSCTRGGLTPNGARPETLPATAPSRRRRPLTRRVVGWRKGRAVDPSRVRKTRAQ